MGDAGTAGSAGEAGTADGSPQDAPAEADVEFCDGCPNGACVDGGVCVECTRDAHCPTAKSRCDLESHVCVVCLPALDNCPSGQYCGPDKQCLKGCKDATSCASGVCTSAHDCARCVQDDECSGQKLCGSGTCANSCSASAPDAGGDASAPDASGDAGAPEGCATGFSCCEPRCVRMENDASNCKTCGTTCLAKQFCGKNGCTDAVLSNVCDLGLVTGVLDGAPTDDPAARDILAALAARCAPVPTTRTVAQAAADVLNPATGRIVVPGGELLVFAGGTFLQKGVGFLEAQRSIGVYSGGTFPNVSFHRSSDGGTIATSLFEEPGNHDIFVIEVGREQTTGTYSMVAYGFHANGTRAAAWYFVNVMLPNLSNYTDSYYVYEWIDAMPNNLLPELTDTFTLKGSGK